MWTDADIRRLLGNTTTATTVTAPAARSAAAAAAAAAAATNEPAATPATALPLSTPLHGEQQRVPHSGGYQQQADPTEHHQPGVGAAAADPGVVLGHVERGAAAAISNLVVRPPDPPLPPPPPPPPAIPAMQLATATTAAAAAAGAETTNTRKSSGNDAKNSAVAAAAAAGSVAASTPAAAGGAATGPGKKRKRQCRFPGCEKTIKSQGHCIKHGARVKPCGVPGCTRQSQGSYGGMCIRHWRERHDPPEPSKKERRQMELQENPPPNPGGESVYDTILPMSVSWKATAKALARGEVIPLAAYFKDNAHRPYGWHRAQERRACGCYPVSDLKVHLEPWEKQLLLVETLLLSGGPNWKLGSHFAHAWGRSRKHVGTSYEVAHEVFAHRGELEFRGDQKERLGKFYESEHRERMRRAGKFGFPPNHKSAKNDGRGSSTGGGIDSHENEEGEEEENKDVDEVGNGNNAGLSSRRTSVGRAGVALSSTATSRSSPRNHHRSASRGTSASTSSHIANSSVKGTARSEGEVAGSANGADVAAIDPITNTDASSASASTPASAYITEKELLDAIDAALGEERFHVDPEGVNERELTVAIEGRLGFRIKKHSKTKVRRRLWEWKREQRAGGSGKEEGDDTDTTVVAERGQQEEAKASSSADSGGASRVVNAASVDEDQRPRERASTSPAVISACGAKGGAKVGEGRGTISDRDIECHEEDMINL